MQRRFALLTLVMLTTSGCATIARSMLRSLLGLEDDCESDDPMQPLYDGGYGFNNPNAERNRRERLRQRGLLTDD